MVVLAVHTFVLYNFWQAEGMWPFFDSLIHMLVFLPLAIALWYPVRYASGLGENIRPDYSNLILGILVVLAVWMAASYGIVRLFRPDAGYRGYYHSSLMLRAAFGLLVFTFVALIYMLISYFAGYEERLEERNMLKASFKNVQLSFLQSQINPHFLFNALNGVNSLIISDPDKAQEVVVELSDFLRYTLKQGHEHFHEVKDEIQNMERYLAIEKIRYGKRLDYSIQYGENVSKARIPALIMLPLLENAIKFSLHQSTAHAKISCGFKIHLESLQVEMCNTFDPDTLNEIHGTGTGLKNIEQRLEVLYGKNGLIHYEKNESFFRLRLRIPQHLDAKALEYLA